MTDYKEHFSEKKFWKKIRKFGGRIPFVREAVAMFYCLTDPLTPTYVKLTVASALGYFILPINAIPDALPLGGLADDTAVIAAALKAIGSHILDDHWGKADKFLCIEGERLTIGSGMERDG